MACFTVAVFQVTHNAHAQFTEPRTYANTPIGINQIELGYAFAHANASVDTSLVVTDANFNLNQGTVSYTLYFGLAHRLTWLEATVPIAGLGGSITGTNIEGSTTGTGDSGYSVAMLLIGGLALSATDFAKHKPTTTVGASFSMTAPTGSYHSDKILNLGADRWSFKPEIGLSHPFGTEQRWDFDAHANVYFYTNNSSYRGRELLRQQPLPGIEGHVSYSFTNNLWVSLDTRYSFRGTTFLNGIDQNNAQQNFIFGSEMNVSLGPRNSVVLEFAKALVHQNGPSLVGVSLKYDFTWGKAYQ